MGNASKIRWSDLDPEESEFLHEAEPELRDAAARHADCPRPELLTALHADALPAELKGNLLGHLAHCSLCRTLAEDLAQIEPDGLTPAEESRIRSRVFSEVPKASPWLGLAWMWHPASLATAAVLVIAAVVGLRLTRAPRHPMMPTRISQPIATSVFQLQKPSVELPAVLVFRGDGEDAGRQYVTALGQALDSFRAGDYVRGVERLEPLATRYPQAPEVPFYMGVCELFLNRNDQAIRHLQRAQQLARPPLAQQAGWYLALAYVHAAKRDEARQTLETLCQTPGEYSAQGCAGLQELSSLREGIPGR